MSFLRGRGDPAAPGGEVSHVAREYERRQQREKENPEKTTVNDTPWGPITSAGSLDQSLD